MQTFYQHSIVSADYATILFLFMEKLHAHAVHAYTGSGSTFQCKWHSAAKQPFDNDVCNDVIRCRWTVNVGCSHSC